MSENTLTALSILITIICVGVILHRMTRIMIAENDKDKAKDLAMIVTCFITIIFSWIIRYVCIGAIA